MTKSKYEQQRDENVQNIQDVFKSLGIEVLAQTVSDVFSEKKKGKAKTVVTDKQGSDIDYDPCSEIDNESDSDDESDDDLTNEVCLFETCSSLYHLIYQVTCFYINNMDVYLGRQKRWFQEQGLSRRSKSQHQ